MGTAFAASQARLGRAAVQRLANATARLPLGSLVEGIYTRAGAVSGVGAAGMLARDVTFVCLAAEVDAATAKGAPIEITPAITGQAEAWLIAQVEHQHELGRARLTLERP